MNSEFDAVLPVIRALEAAGISYMLVGSISRNQYTTPRSTHDADIVIEYEPGVLAKVMERLGENYVLDRQSRLEMITSTARNVISIRDDEFCIEVFRLSDDAHDQERFRRRVRGVYFGEQAWIPTAEDVIVWKLRWAMHRPKDLADLQDIIAVQARNVDWDYIHRWAERHGTRDLLEKIVASIPLEEIEDGDDLG
jgi:hypothetical protein